MRTDIPLVSLSALDEKRFGVKTAKTSPLRAGDMGRVMDFCAIHRVEFLIARCPSDELKAAQEMERLGFSLMDTLLYYSCDLKKRGVPVDSAGPALRTAVPGDGNAVREVAKEAFRGYFGHYHADPRLDRDACDEVYTDWAYNSCISTETADTVLIAESPEGGIAGFATMREKSEGVGEGVLFGVAPEFQGKGIYRRFMTGGMEWCIQRGLGSMVVSTQVTNTAVQKVWVRLGFEPSHSFYTFHKWFTKA